ncbi:hypothetical protein NIES2104_56860 [Leptolyngbya sp. NIES-2104]|nr:hypothetical protein NIES2104_56860 [Leptolyngbya sp. NIES-2104]
MFFALGALPLVRSTEVDSLYTQTSTDLSDSSQLHTETYKTKAESSISTIFRCGHWTDSTPTDETKIYQFSAKLKPHLTDFIPSVNTETTKRSDSLTPTVTAIATSHNL